MKFGKLVGSIDVGTSSVRFIIFRAGTDDIICYHQIEVQSIFPQEGWCEQDPQVVYENVAECIEIAVKELRKLGAHEKAIVAIGVTNQRESVIVWDRASGTPLHNAIIWLDNRTSSTVDELVESIPSNSKNINYLKPLCGLPLSPYFSALKLRWLKDNVSVVRKAMLENTCQFGTFDTWIIYKLTGGAQNKGLHITDVTNASRTMLMNLETLQWDQHLLDFFKLPRSMLPVIAASVDNFGEIKTGILTGKQMTACLGDQQAALVGQQCLQRGQVKSTYGTGCFLLYNTGSAIVQSSHGLLTTVGYQMGRNATPVYALEGSVAIAGASINWLKDNLNLFSSVAEVEAMAREVNDTGDVYFVPAFSGLFAPYWDQEARGVICGLTDETTSEHIVRATLEAVAFQVRDILESMRKDSGAPLAKLMVDGGMTNNALFMQLQADLVGISVVRAKIAETTALGAALAAYKGFDPNYNIGAPLSEGTVRTTYTSKIKDNERDMRYGKWKMAVERALGWDTPTTTEGRALYAN